MDQRLLVVSPVRNEAAHLELVARALERQTRPPDLWVVVDDGSTDRSPEILRRAGRADQLHEGRHSRHAPAPGRVKDRLATAAAPRTFNARAQRGRLAIVHPYRQARWRHGAPSRLFRAAAGRVRAATPSSASRAGCTQTRLRRGAARPGRRADTVEHHVPGTLKCYSRECFEAIGGIQERLGWDTIDETYARMRGYQTRAFPDLVAHHHRPWGSADGILQGTGASRPVRLHRSVPASVGDPAGVQGGRAPGPGGSQVWPSSTAIFGVGHAPAPAGRRSGVPAASSGRELRGRARDEIAQRMSRRARAPLRRRGER